ncbi:MAG: hypothetical protein V3W41_07920 [Planctomycetota bacterium]
MMKINLLPSEYRKAERTPFIILLPILAGLICVLSAGAVAGYVKFSWRAEVEAERVQLQGQMRQKQPRLNYNASLLKEEAEYKKQAETISKIASSRILMTKKLDELCNLIAEGDAGQHGGYMVWVEQLKTKPAKRKRGRKKKGPQPAGELSFSGYVLANNAPLQDFNRFHRAIKDSEMYREQFMGINDPKGSVTEFTDDKVPTKGWSFALSADMTDPAEIMKTRAKKRLEAKKEARRKRK